jgi:hypothetical protein
MAEFNDACDSFVSMTKAKHPKRTAALIAGGTVLLIFAGWFFQPWTLFTNRTVVEAFPSASETVASPSGSEEVDAPEYPILLSKSKFISHEHSTRGVVKIFELANGERVLRIEGLDTSDGPQLEVWLSDSPVIEGTAGWKVFDDGNYASLGVLKGNIGDQNYEIPEDVDLNEFISVSIWCVRFAVSFGAAEINLASA